MSSLHGDPYYECGRDGKPCDRPLYTCTRCTPNAHHAILRILDAYRECIHDGKTCDLSLIKRAMKSYYNELSTMNLEKAETSIMLMARASQYHIVHKPSLADELEIWRIVVLDMCDLVKMLGKKKGDRSLTIATATNNNGLSGLFDIPIQTMSEKDIALAMGYSNTLVAHDIDPRRDLAILVLHATWSVHSVHTLEFVQMLNVAVVHIHTQYVESGADACRGMENLMPTTEMLADCQRRHAMNIVTHCEP